MQNHFEINVALNGQHFFATHERSAVTQAQHDKIVEAFRVKFPASEGYSISSTFYECVGHSVPVRN